MAWRKKKKKKKSWSLLGFLFESRAAVLLIATNSATFIFLQKQTFDTEKLAPVILYPGNLLQGKVACLVTTGFIHHHWPHLLLNMLGLFVFARIVENKLGMMKTFYIYFGSLIISMLFSTLVYAFYFHKNMAIIGASGAVMGLMAAAMLLDPFRITYEMIVPIPVMCKGWLFLFADLKGLMGGETDGISHLAHLCGFISIAFLLYFLSHEDRKMLRTGLIINVFSFFIFLFLKQKFGHVVLPS